MDNMKLKSEILHALDEDSKIDASHIGIIVENGIVTLTGRVRSLADSAYAIGVAKNVSGVKAIAQEITIIDDLADDQSDESISANLIKHFERDSMIPESQIKISVRNGCVTVTGHVEWLYQKNAIEQAIRGVEGVSDYTNQVRIEARVSDSEMESRVGRKLATSDQINSDGLNIIVHDGDVTLSGVIESRKVHNEIVEVVNHIPGVNKIIDHLTYVEF